MTIVMLTFGEIIPKMVATADAERWALRLAWPMRYVTAALTPIGRSFQFVTELMLGRSASATGSRSSSPKKTFARWSTSARSSA